MRTKQQSGFSLLEVLVVLFLMGVLLTSFTPHFGSASRYVRQQMNQANIQRIEGAVQLYKIDVGASPQNVIDLVSSPQGVSGWRGPYLNEVPINPFDSELGYKLNAAGRVSDPAAN